MDSDNVFAPLFAETRQEESTQRSNNGKKEKTENEKKIEKYLEAIQQPMDLLK